MEHEFTPRSGEDLEQLAAQLDRAMATLARTEQRLASPQIAAGETIFRDPKDAYHQITLGAVLVDYGLSAHHARLLDGLLSMSFDQVQHFLDEVSRLVGDGDEKANVGLTLLELLEALPGRLDEFGRYAEWRRAFDRYMTRTQPYLAGLTDENFERLVTRPPSKKQMHLIRVTCAYHGLPFPTVLDRLTAFEWLRDIGANAKYREIRP